MNCFLKALKLIIITALILVSAPAKAISQTQDQVYLPAATAWDQIPNDSYLLGQSFKPELNRLTRVDVNLNGAAADVTLTLADSSNNFIISETNNVGTGTNAFTFPAPVSLTKGTEYRIFLTDNGAALTWGKTGTSGYSRGSAFIGGNPVATQDHLFRTWGYDVVESTPSEPSVLEPPTDLSAFDVPNDEGKAVRLTWMLTTTKSYDGYNIYRAEKIEQNNQENREYLLVGTADFGDTEFTDEKKLDPTKTYIYHARTYKGVYESADSEEAEIKPEDNIAPNAPQRLQVINSGKGWVELQWQAVQAPDLAGYIIKYGRDSTDLNKTQEVDKNQTTYKIVRLSRGTRYYFIVTAKDTSGNASPSSSRIDFYVEGLNWTWYLYIAIFVAMCAGLYLYIAFRKRIWPFKKRKPIKKLDKNKTNDKIKSNHTEVYMAEAKKIGSITHFFGKIGVGIIKLTDSLAVGDKIKIKGATTEIEQEITSMQVDHKEIKEAKSGDEVGVKLDGKVRDGDEVFIA